MLFKKVRENIIFDDIEIFSVKKVGLILKSLK